MSNRIRLCGRQVNNAGIGMNFFFVSFHKKQLFFANICSSDMCFPVYFCTLCLLVCIFVIPLRPEMIKNNLDGEKNLDWHCDADRF